jgi:hypothetical protein
LPTEPFVFYQCPEQESNLQSPGFKPSRSADWRTWAEWSWVDSNGAAFAARPQDHRVDSPGVAPGFPACGAGVVLLDHEPVLPPEVRGQANLRRGTPPRTRTLTNWVGTSRAADYTRDARLIVGQRKPWDSNPQVAMATICFQDRLLIRPDDFRLQAAGAGIEPTPRRSERPVLPLNDPAVVDP